MSDASPLDSDILLRHENFVLGLARHLVRDDAAAQDIVQETWIALWRRGGAFTTTRSWLASVVRKRAAHAQRSNRRRAEHERGAARHDVHESPESPREALEMQHAVVAAVLGLDEPYRSTVIATYYEAKRPEQIARESGVTASTVRARLTRAREQLRETLDRKHGSRGQWLGMLSTWVLRREESLVAPATLFAWALAGAAAVAIATWIAFGSRTSDIAVPMAVAPADVQTTEASSLPRESREFANEDDARIAATTPNETKPSDDTNEPKSELHTLLTRTRQIKRVLIARATVPSPDVLRAYDWMSSLADSGVARIAARERFGFDTQLPWLQGGGAFWSFTQRSHDYQSHPQIEFQSGVLNSGFAGSDIGILHSFGRRVSFADLAQDSARVERRLDREDRAAWDVLWSELESNAGESARKLVDDYAELGVEKPTFLRVGDCHLLRAVADKCFDIVVAFEVAALDEQSVTIAWRVLRSRAISNPDPLYRSKESADSLPTPPQDILDADDGTLEAELQRLRQRGAELLFTFASSPYDELARSLRSHRDAGLVRIVEAGSPWSEFSTEREGGAYFSFVTESHSYDDEPNLSLQASRFRTGFAGARTGWFMPLGDVALDALARWTPPPALADAWDFMWHVDPTQLGDGDRRKGASAAFQRARDLGLELGFIDVVPNSTFLLCSLDEQRHLVLAAARVHAHDEFGVVLEWRRLRLLHFAR